MIELMIVMVIITTLASLAIPAYQDYVIRAKVVNMLSFAQPTKLAVTDSLISGTPAVIDKMVDQEFAKEISVAEHVITITGNSEKLGIKEKDKVLKITLTPDFRNQNIISWKCAISPPEFKNYAPAECRH